MKALLIALLITLAIVFNSFTLVIVSAHENAILIRQSSPMEGGKNLGTKDYIPLKDEVPFLKKKTEKTIKLWPNTEMPQPPNLSKEEWAKIQKEQEEEEKKQIPVADYALSKQVGEYVGWFGIVREANFDEKKNQTTVLVEHKYFDGLTDLHLHIVSIFGAGDFKFIVPGKISDESIPTLSLVCIYGIVKDGDGSVPLLNAEYIRVWDWGLFTFMDYGQDKSNLKWQALRKVRSEDIYDPNPTKAFYEERLGKR